MSAATVGSARRPTGPHGHPVLGALPAVRRDALGFLMTTFQTHGDVATYRLGPIRSYLISHPDGVKRVLQEHVKQYTKDHVSYSMVRWLVGDGLLASQGETWLRQRRLTQPAFHRQRITAMADLMVSRTTARLDRWQPVITSKQALSIEAEMLRLTLTIVGDALFGSQVEAQVAVVSRAFNLLSAQFVARFRSGNVFPPILPTPDDRAWRAAIVELDQIVYAIIAERRHRNEDTGDLISMLMQARDEETGAQMDDQALRDEVLTMLLAGHETTATALTWAWGLIDQHPAVAQRLHDELDSVLAGRMPTAADVPHLVYTRMIIDETLRLYPPVYILSRKVVADDTIGGYRIPKGTSVDLSPYVVHRHPTFWPDPERFDPERFAPELAARRHKFAYIPFSAGPRQCIGNSFALMEATLIMATVAQRYRLRLAKGVLPVPEPLVTLRPKGGMIMRIEDR